MKRNFTMSRFPVVNHSPGFLESPEGERLGQTLPTEFHQSMRPFYQKNPIHGADSV